MKRLFTKIALGSLAVASPFLLKAQELIPGIQQVCDITAHNSIELRRQTRENILSLQKSGRLASTDTTKVAPAGGRPQAAVSAIRFQWPLRSKNAEEYAYLGSKNYVDLDTTFTIHSNGDTTFHMIDYDGGNHTYNGHNGMDILIAPLWWERQKKANVFAIAAAPGTIVSWRDGGFDGNCSWTNPPWKGAGASGNFIGVLHSDNSTISYYKHLKNGSLTPKNIGDHVSTGEYLGVIASSGRSTAPHLHFEVHVGWQDASNDGTLVEPFFGVENYTTGGVSLWSNQLPYIEPEILAMETHTSTGLNDFPDVYSSGCDSTIDLSTLRNRFSKNRYIAFSTVFRDFHNGKKANFFVLDPNGSIKESWSFDNVDSIRLATWRHAMFLPADATDGTWSYNVAFNNKTYTHHFTVGTCDTQLGLSGVQSGNDGFIVSNYITSTATISGSVNNYIRYKADNYVRLNPGFEATAGCTFVADTGGCAAVQ